MTATPLLALVLLVLLQGMSVSCSASKVGEDQHVKCQAWAFLGECELNGGYMLKHCASSCAQYEQALAAATPTDLYSISEVDFLGNPFHFQAHRNQRLLIVNGAASPDEPLTDANFRLLATLSKFRSADFEILLYPSFQFEKSGSNKDPYFVSFYAQQSGFEGIVMRHADLNGIHRCDTFKYLMGKAIRGSTLAVKGNFHAKIIIDPNGKINNEASQMLSALFTAGRNATLSVEAASSALVEDKRLDDGTGTYSDDWIEPTGGGGGTALLEVVRSLCDRYLCAWFHLSEADCGQLRMQILMDVY